jgi:hypothetical protein
MATEEIGDLRNRYVAAYAGYITSVRALSEASDQREWPPNDVTAAEESAYNEFRDARQVLLRALRAYPRKRS